MIVCLPALNIYEKQQRIAAHKHTPTAREELKRLRELAPRLKELGVQRVICSDLDAQSGEALARRLDVPFEEWESLRRFNYGKLHGQLRYKAEQVREQLQRPEVPIKSGDSWASFEKRIAASRDKLAKLGDNLDKVLVIVDADVLAGLTGASGAMRYHIYQAELKHGEPNEIAPVRAASAR